jgi:hypothetical protein
MSDDFVISIILEVYEDGVLTKTLRSEALSDETIHMIMEDVAETLNEGEQ